MTTRFTNRTHITLEINCPICGKEYEVTVPIKGYEAWQRGELIQNAMPDVSPEVRESLISKLCETCQMDIFGGEI